METIAEALRQAIAYHHAGQLQAAERIYSQILSADPRQARAWHYLGVIAHESSEHENAIAYIKRALELQPSDAEAHNNLGMVFEFLGKFDEAVTCCQRALELRPDYAAAHHNLGYVFTSQGDFDAAAACYRRCLEIQPNFAKARYHQATLALLRGDFEHGWPESEWRWKVGKSPLRQLPLLKWDGQPLNGKTILLYNEQGFGDMFQFVRYTSVIERLGATVVLECPKPLVPLLTNCRGNIQLIGEGDELPPVDFHTALLSLPGTLQTRLDTIPAVIPYVFADSVLIAEWREKLSAVRGFRIGVNWHGRSGQGTFRRRDFPPNILTLLYEIPGVQLISLQKGEGHHRLIAGNSQPPILDLGDEFDTLHGAFMDTAAIMMNLDLVITSDTSIAHLAGALGVPVWTVLPFVPDWRWLLDRTDSPWYPTMRLFRQPTLGDWAGVFEQVKEALVKLVSQANATSGRRNFGPIDSR